MIANTQAIRIVILIILTMTIVYWITFADLLLPSLNAFLPCPFDGGLVKEYGCRIHQTAKIMFAPLAWFWIQIARWGVASCFKRWQLYFGAIFFSLVAFPTNIAVNAVTGYGGYGLALLAAVAIAAKAAILLWWINVILLPSVRLLLLPARSE